MGRKPWGAQYWGKYDYLEKLRFLLQVLSFIKEEFTSGLERSSGTILLAYERKQQGRKTIKFVAAQKKEDKRGKRKPCHL